MLGGEYIKKREKVEYDHKSSVSFVIGLQTASGLMAGFAFTGTLVVLTRLGDPTTLLSQIVLGILYVTIVLFLTSLFEIHILNLLIGSQSPKQILPKYPDRNRLITWYMFLGSFLLTVSIPVMFLIKGLIPLFVLTIYITMIGNILFDILRWMPVQKKIEVFGIV